MAYLQTHHGRDRLIQEGLWRLTGESMGTKETPRRSGAHLEVGFIFRAVSVISDPSGGAVGRLTRYLCLALTPLAGGWQIHSKLAPKGCQTKIQVILSLVYRAAGGRATGRFGNGMKEIITAETKVNAPT